MDRHSRYDEDDCMNAPRGIVWGFAFVAVIWAGIFATVQGCSTVATTDTTTTATTTVPPAQVGQYVSAWALDPVDGAKAQDKGDEIVGFMGNADYRFLANDSKGNGYFMSDTVKAAGAFAWQRRPGGWLVWAKDFDSITSGRHYKWVGFRLQKSANPMVTDNPLVVSDSDMRGTFRVYWQTVSGKLSGNVGAYNSGQYQEWAISQGLMNP